MIRTSINSPSSGGGSGILTGCALRRCIARYVRNSRGEFSCAKGGYAATRCGWFSDRSQAYLAAGRPVILQSTGFEDLLPTGKGLFAFTTMEEAVEAIRAVLADYPLHSAAARQIALEHFDSDKILRRLLAEAGLP